MKIASSLLATVFAMNAVAAEVPSPAAAGFSEARLQRLTEKFEGDVKAGTIPGAVVLVVLLARASWTTSAVWFASGLTDAFAAGAGFTIGTLYLPAGILLALSGLLADLNRPKMFLRHLPIGIGAAAVQLAAMAIAVLRLTGGTK